MLGFGTKCGYCGKSGTKAVEIEPNGSTYKQIAIACNHCNAILSSTGYYDTGTVVKQLETKIAALEQQIRQVQQTLQNMEYQLRR